MIDIREVAISFSSVFGISLPAKVASLISCKTFSSFFEVDRNARNFICQKTEGN